jgi:hypothetical protein
LLKLGLTLRLILAISAAAEVKHLGLVSLGFGCIRVFRHQGEAAGMLLQVPDLF